MDLANGIVRAFTGWLFWMQAAAHTLDSTTIYIMAAVSVAVAVVSAFMLRQLGVIGKGVLITLLIPAVFVLLVAFSQVQPVFFSPEDLAKSQVSI